MRKLDNPVNTLKFFLILVLILVSVNIFIQHKVFTPYPNERTPINRSVFQTGKSYMSWVFNSRQAPMKNWESLQCSTIDQTQRIPTLKPQGKNSNVPSEFYHLNWTNHLLDNYKVLKWPRWDICEVDKDDKLLLLFIISDKSSQGMRRSVRESFGSVKKISSWQIRTVFTYGDNHNQTLSYVANENDLLIGNFADSYDKMTHKVAFGFKWIQLYCPKANYVFRLTQDTFINLTKVVKFLDDKVKENVTRLYHGVPVSGATIVHTGKSKLLSPVKWKAQYPTYNTGCGILFSQSVIQDINFLFCKVPLCFPDDTYYGALMEMLGVPPTGKWTYHFQLWVQHETALRKNTKTTNIVVPADATMVHFVRLAHPAKIQSILWRAYLDTAPESLELHNL